MTASCSGCRRNAVARQVYEASVEVESRNQAWALATPGGSQEVTDTGQPSPLPQQGLIETYLPSLTPRRFTGTLHHPQGQPPRPDKDLWRPRPGQPHHPHPQQGLSPGRLQGLLSVAITTYRETIIKDNYSHVSNNNVSATDEPHVDSGPIRLPGGRWRGKDGERKGGRTYGDRRR